MNKAEERINEAKIAFTAGPWLKDHYPLRFGIPAKAWSQMRDFRGIEFNLTNYNIPIRVTISTVKDRAQATEIMQRFVDTAEPRDLKQEFILTFLGKDKFGLFMVVLITDAGRYAMANGKKQFDFDFRNTGAAISLSMLARPMRRDCEQALRVQLGNATVRDASADDISFSLDASKHTKH
jgi:hypothetical protein